MRRLQICAIALLSLVALCCVKSSPQHRVWEGPRVVLKPYEIIGMVEFTSSTKGELAALATRRFTEAARRDQEMLRVVDVGTQKQALASVGQKRWTPEIYREVGQKHGLKSIFQGTLTLSKVQPTAQISSLLRSGQVTANVAATLEVQMIEVESGASVWSRSASATRTLGHVSVLGGKDFVFDAADPEAAYGELVDALVAQVAQDLQGRWVIQ